MRGVSGDILVTMVENQGDKTLTLILLGNSVLKSVQVCGERLTLLAVSQSLVQIWPK